MDNDRSFSSPTLGQQKAKVVLGVVSRSLMLGGLAAAGAGVALTPWLFIPAGALGLASGVLMIVRSAIGTAATFPVDGTKAHIGMGAEIHATARIEPGAVVEMGATVHEDAVVESGAVVRMGATVGKGAKLESGAVLGWGATLEEGGTVRRAASVGAGATVRRHAVLGIGQHLGAGGEVRGTRLGPTEEPLDERAKRIDEVCGRLEGELRRASPAVRAFLSTSEESIESLRATCRDLLTRERGLRREVSPELLSRLEHERAALQQRIEAANDAQVRASLQQAVAALDEQREQRAHLGRNADRLDAELTRLCWSIEGITAQLVRAQSHDGASPEPELTRGLAQVREELVAIAEALEAVDGEEREATRRRTPGRG